jgi:hypothetical protein
MRVQPFAYRRISRISDLLGEEEIRKVVDEVENEFGKAQDPRVWDIFLHGTHEQCEQFRQEVQRELSHCQVDEAVSKGATEEPDKE